MITFNQIGHLGRLGNQLFQYAAVRGVSLRNGWTSQLPDSIHDTSWHGQPCLLSNFNLNCQIKSNKDISKCTTYQEICESFTFDQDHVLQRASSIHPSFFQIQDNTNLVGLFDNHLYFHEYREQLRKELTLINGDEEKSIKILNDIKEKYGEEKEIVSIHFRRGDLELDNRLQKLYAKGNSLFTWDSPFGLYLEEALKHFQEDKYIFLLFTGGQRNENTERGDMGWIKQAFTKDDSYDLLNPEQGMRMMEASKRGLTPNRIVYAENNTTLLDFALMKNCDHNITGLYSTYTWWASYLNNTPNKKTIAPRVFSDPKQGFYPEDFILTDWAYQKLLGLQSSYTFINSISQFKSIRGREGKI